MSTPIKSLYFGNIKLSYIYNNCDILILTYNSSNLQTAFFVFFSASLIKFTIRHEVGSFYK